MIQKTTWYNYPIIRSIITEIDFDSNRKYENFLIFLVYIYAENSVDELWESCYNVCRKL